ncbi:MAG: hypothetical protein ABSF55_02760 [Candidatus Staskawiczbacteria bacterium]
MKDENAKAGVDYFLMKGFKEAMQKVAQRTAHLCARHGSGNILQVLPTVNGHGGVFSHYNNRQTVWVTTMEGVGTRAWIAMLLNFLGLPDPTCQYHFGGLGIDMFLAGANDNASHGGDPVFVTDEVSCGNSEFFASPQAMALAASFEKALFTARCSLIQGESPTYPSLMPKSRPPVKYAPSMSVNVQGIAEHFVSGERVRPRDSIIGFRSSGLHANGISPITHRLTSPPFSPHGDAFLRKLNGWTVGQEALIPTRSYIGLVHALLNAGIDVHAFLPMTGDGVGKFASDGRYHYNIEKWPPEEMWPPLFLFMLEVGMPKEGVATSFNCGIGYVWIGPPSQEDAVMEVASKTKIDGEGGFYEPFRLGDVEEGKAGTYFKPWDLHLPPPGTE